MIKTMGLARRREGMSVDEFQAYWREVHAPLVLQVPGLRRYIQCHSLPELYDGEEPPPFDGVAQLWFDSLAALDEARKTPEWQVIAADAPNFLVPGVRGLLVTEVPIIDALPRAAERQGMIKRMGFLTRKEGMSVEDFQRYWRDVHSPLVVESLPAMRRYVQAHPLPEVYGTEREPPFDGAAESWWDSPETDQLSARARAERPRSTATDDLANFARPSTTPALVTREVVILD